MSAQDREKIVKGMLRLGAANATKDEATVAGEIVNLAAQFFIDLNRIADALEEIAEHKLKDEA